MGKRNTSQLKKSAAGRLSQFAKTRAEADRLLEKVFSEGPSHLETLRIGRRKERLDEIRTEFDAARARVEAHFEQPTMSIDAIRRRISSIPELDVEVPFNVMAGKRR